MNCQTCPYCRKLGGSRVLCDSPGLDERNLLMLAAIRSVNPQAYVDTIADIVSLDFNAVVRGDCNWPDDFDPACVKQCLLYPKESEYEKHLSRDTNIVVVGIKEGPTGWHWLVAVKNAWYVMGNNQKVSSLQEAAQAAVSYLDEAVANIIEKTLRENNSQPTIASLVDLVEMAKEVHNDLCQKYPGIRPASWFTMQITPENVCALANRYKYQKPNMT